MEQSLYKKLEAKFDSPLIKGAIGSYSLKILSTALNFITGVLLARLLGLEGLGIYTYSITLVIFLGVLALLGQPALLVRYIAAYHANLSWELAKGLLSLSNRVIAFSSISIALIAAFFAGIIKGFGSTDFFVFSLALVLLPIISLSTHRQAAMKGLKKVVTGQMPELLVKPLLISSSLTVAYIMFSKAFSVYTALYINIASSFIAYIAGAALLRHVTPHELSNAPIKYDTGLWIKSSMPFLLISVLQIINFSADILMLGILRGAAETGVYTVAARISNLILFILASVGLTASPMIASLYAKNEIKELQRLLTNSARLIFIVTIPTVILTILYSDLILGMFGEDFIDAKLPLIILCTGLAITSFLGISGHVALMIGLEKEIAKFVALSSVLNITLNLLLIPKYGAIGAAIANTTSFMFWYICATIFVYRKTGLIPIIFYTKL